MRAAAAEADDDDDDEDFEGGGAGEGSGAGGSADEDDDNSDSDAEMIAEDGGWVAGRGGGEGLTLPVNYTLTFTVPPADLAPAC